MRDIVCETNGCKLLSKMPKTTQVGAGVIQDGESYLVPLKSIQQTKSKIGGGNKRKSQVGKGKRKVKSAISIAPASGLKGRKRKCVKPKKSVAKKTTKKTLKKTKSSKK